MSQATSAAIYKQLFTDCEWDAICSALKDYADYGDEESAIADSIDAKITQIYKLTENNWVQLLSFHSQQLMRHTKAQVLSQFRYNWKCETISDPSLKGDVTAKRESWNNFVDMLNKEGYVSNYQAYNWSNPFW